MHHSGLVRECIKRAAFQHDKGNECLHRPKAMRKRQNQLFSEEQISKETNANERLHSLVYATYRYVTSLWSACYRYQSHFVLYAHALHVLEQKILFKKTPRINEELNKNTEGWIGRGKENSEESAVRGSSFLRERSVAE